LPKQSASSGDPDLRSGLDKAAALVAARGCPAQLCVLAGGRVVLDLAVGCRPDSLFFLFSASKPLVALLVHQLAERGALDLDDRVADYWPEFGQQGKQSVTIRQVLQHRSGLPVASSMARDALAMTNWQLSVRNLERATPSFPPGEVPAYHVLSYGFILGELVQRVTRRPVRDVLQASLLEPLGLRGTALGLPAEHWPRHVPVGGRGVAEAVTALMVNRRAVRQAVIPAASVSATARDLAWLYQSLLDGGERDGVRVLRPETIQQATQPSSDGEIDRYLKLPIRWSHGFQLGGERAGPTRLGGGHGPMGRLASRTTFGHNGSYVCIGWADPVRQVAVGYLTGRMVSRAEGARHMAEISDAIISATA
jgi:CubicO group peptidase (beta-lactamase class C family)